MGKLLHCLLPLLFPLASFAPADEVVPRPHEVGSVLIRFDEPVVSTSRVEEDDEKPADDNEESPLFTLTGNDAHRPIARWEDQNLLRLSFAPGASCATVFRLSFKPGFDHYLSGRRMPESSFSFSCPPNELEAQEVPGVEGGAWIVWPGGERVSQESLSFSASHPARYSFRRILKQDKGGELRLGEEEIPGVVSEARLRHGLPTPLLMRMARIKGMDWEALTPDSVLPGAALVQPEQALDPSADWALTVAGDEAKAFLPVPVAVPPSALETAVSLRAVEGEKEGDPARLELVIHFDAPVAAEQLPRLFREMELCITPYTSRERSSLPPSLPTQLSEDGCRRLARMGEDVFSFTLLPPQASPGTPSVNLLSSEEEEGRGCSDSQSPHLQTSRASGSDADVTQKASYQAPGECTEMRLAVDAPLPAMADITLKKGIRSLRGLATRSDRLHRVSLLPSTTLITPWLATSTGGAEENLGISLLPLHGKHDMRLNVANVASLTVQALRLPPAEGARQLMIEAETENNLTLLLHLRRELTYRQAYLMVRQRLDLLTPEEQKRLPEIEQGLAEVQSLIDARRQQRHSLLEHAETFAPQTVNLFPEGERAFFRSADVTLSLDELTGGNTLPGLYLIRVCVRPLLSVRNSWSLVLPPDDAALVEEYLVQVSDLQALQDGGVVLITRLSDGSSVPEGEIQQVSYDSDEGFLLHDSIPVQNGLARLPSPPSSGDILILRSGEDSLLLPARPSYSRIGQPPSLFLCTDRLLYRPGEEVHLRGIVRRQEGNACRLPQQERLTWWVQKPDGERLLTRSASLSDVGAFDASFSLPKGEEDICGAYAIHVEGFTETASVNCQVFRRNAFEASLKVDVDPVSPQTFHILLSACDYNTAPLSGGKVQLDIASSVPEAAEGEPLPPAGEKDSFTLRRELRLDAQGQASLTCTLAPLAEDASFSFLNVEGSVANDREEYLNLEPSYHRLYPADFLPVWNEDRLSLQDVRTDKPLARDQRVHLRLIRQKESSRTLPNGFTLWKSEPLCLWEGDVDIPAHCDEGVTPPWRDAFPQQAACLVELQGTDAEGHSLRRRHRFMPQRKNTRPGRRMPLPGEARLEGSDLLLPVDFSADGTAHILLTHAGGVRHFLLPVRSGKQELRLPLTEEEWGSLSVTALLPLPDEEGLFTRWEAFTPSSPAYRPRPETELHVDIDPLPDSFRPGSQVALSGRVATHQGSPARAEVTLWAVDEGMHALAPQPLPYLTEYFYKRWLAGFRPLLSPEFAQPAPALRPLLLPGVWRGEYTEDGRLWKPVRYEKEIGDECSAFFAGGEMMEDSYQAAPALARSAKPVVVMQKADANFLPEEDGEGGVLPPRLRQDFTPTPLWVGALSTDEQGRFQTTFSLPDTLTSYRLVALAVGKEGSSFGQTEDELAVNQPLMLTPGVPLFMSTGDTLLLPLTLTNLTDQPGTWHVRMEGDSAPQDITLAPGATGTLYFSCTAGDEGERHLRWQATGDGDDASDAVEGSFPVRFPAPLLREIHRRMLTAPGAAQDAAHAEAGENPAFLHVLSLLSPELADSPSLAVELSLSASPLLHLNGCVEELLSYPYGCTEQLSSALLPWILHKRLAPASPRLQHIDSRDAARTAEESITRLFRRQQKDGGLSYWGEARRSSPWVSAHAALVLTLAQEMGFNVPGENMSQLRHYLSALDEKELSPLTRYAIARACGQPEQAAAALEDALREKAPDQPGSARPGWWTGERTRVDLAFIAALRKESNPTSASLHAALLEWMRSRGHDSRHRLSTWQNSWPLIALAEYFLRTPETPERAIVRLADGSTLTLNGSSTQLSFPSGKEAAAAAPFASLTPLEGTAYMSLSARARPRQTSYPGLTEKGLQVTRLYEKKGEDGRWQEAREFRVGDVVRVTLTCAKAADELEYFVLEDELPACMEAINPDIPSQAAGFEPLPWSAAFDHREYLADRVRGFCTRWQGRELLNMSYYARVKRAGVSTAPPAQAQLMYEPQTYGLSPSAVIISR